MKTLPAYPSLFQINTRVWLTELQDQLSPASYDWNGDDLQGRGLYLDMAPWQASIFSLAKRS